MKNSILDLLPYNKNHLVSSILGRIRICQLIDFFCQKAQIAIKSYIYGSYELFDAQVSENLCQIRAYILSAMSDDNQNLIKNLALASIEIKSLQIKTKSLHDRYKGLEKSRPSHYTKEIDKAITLKKFLEENHLNMPIAEETFFLIQAHVLSHYKLVDEYEISYGIDYQRLCKDISINSKTFIRKFIHHLQRKVSELSCNFIFKLLHELNPHPSQIFLTTNLYAKDQDERHVIACYDATKTILEHASRNQKVICISVTRISKNEKDTITFALNPELNHVVSTEVLGNNNLIMLFKGIVQYPQYMFESKKQYVERFLKVGFKDIILANVAQHSQFSGVFVNKRKHNPYSAIDLSELPTSYRDYITNTEKEFLRHKYFATEAGCCPENASLFLLTHVRCANAALLVDSLAPNLSYI